MKRRCAVLGALGLLVLPAASRAATTPAQAPGVWPQASQVPGGIARVALGPAATRPVAHAQGDGGDVPLLVLGDAIEWTALVGIPLSAAPGPARISVQTEAGLRQMAYTVTPKKYLEQQLKVSPRTVDLSPEDLARYERERVHLASVMATFTEPLPNASALRMRCRRRGDARVRSGCGACSTARRAIRTAAWTLRPPPARRWLRHCRGG